MGRREKPLDPAQGALQRFAYELRKLRDEAGMPTYRAMALRTGYSGPTLSAAAAGERLPTLPVLKAYVIACGGDPGEWERRWQTALAETADTRPADDTEDSPYPGLARFDTGDGEHFHGRDDLIAELVTLTGRARITAVVGASGSGKSSLLRAGLTPVLREPDGTGTRPGAIRLLTPGPHPARAHDALFTPHPAPGDTLLVVDQFEEVFTLCTDSAERDRFLDRLLTAAVTASRLRVVLAVRADFYGRCADHGPLAEALRDSTLLVGPMPPAQLREAIVRPAAVRRLVVERALTARVVADVSGEPGALPLMAHALREIWRRRTGNTLTLAAYEAVGGVHGAVAHTAEALHARCTPTEAAAVRALLLRLVNPGDGTEDTRRPVDRTELDADETTARVLEQLVRARLLTVDGDTVDLAHEALIGAWPRLRAWVDEDRERLRVHRRLTEAARTWAELGRDAGALYRGVRLTQARDAFAERGVHRDELSTLERDFLTASVDRHEEGRRAATRAARRLKALAAALAVLLCLAVVAGVAAWRQSGVNARQRDAAEARRAAAQAEALRSSQPRTAMRLALAAWHTADLPETREALRTAAAQSELDVFTQPEDGGRALDAPAWLSADGRILTSVSRNRAAQWDVRAHRRIGSVALPGLSDGVTDVSPDGRLVAYSAPDGDGALIAGVADGGTRRIAPGSWTDTDGAFGPSGRTFLVRRLVRGSDSGRATLEVWDVRRQRMLFRYDHADEGGAMPVLSPDDRYLAWCTDETDRLRVFDVVEQRAVATRPPRATERLLCGGEQLTFTPDGRAVAGSTSEGVVTWDFRADRERPRLPLPEGAYTVEFHGAYALTWGPGSLALWRTDAPAPTDDGPREPLLTFPVANTAGDIRLDVDDGVLRYRENGRTSVVRTLALHGLMSPAWRDKPTAPDRPSPVTVHGTESVAVDATGRTALTWEGALIEVPTGKRRKGVEGEDYLRDAAFSPDGRYLAAADVSGRLTLWDAHTWRRIAVLRAVATTTHDLALAFSADGSLFAASAPDGSVQVWETASPDRPAATLPAGDAPVTVLRFTSGGGELRITTAHLPARVRPLEPIQAAAELCARAKGGLSEGEWGRYFPSAAYRGTCGT
ncbi:hypothetical protein AB0I98_00045 [Streptomyces sp. NPDC050211]|uniref:nSTAND1 domain-containing NTPase n=1 Tax=Streptomyces sp. NPDC050211 TaxID=3154932 RepID=UPI003432195F